MSTLSASTILLVLTRQCLYTCEHCHTMSGPRVKDSFSHLGLIRTIHQLARARSIRNIIFTGGEPFLNYPLLKAGVFEAASLGLSPFVWTSGYFISTKDDLRYALKPLAEVGLRGLICSSDAIHGNAWLQPLEEQFRSICTELNVDFSFSSLHPKDAAQAPTFARRGDVISTGPIPVRGRYVEHIPASMARWAASDLTQCPHQNLNDPDHLWLDAKGLIHICPGIPVHNMNLGHIRRFMMEFRPEDHPVVGPLLAGGPYELMKSLGLSTDQGFVDHCHLCFWARKESLKRQENNYFPPSWYY